MKLIHTTEYNHTNINWLLISSGIWYANDSNQPAFHGICFWWYGAMDGLECINLCFQASWFEGDLPERVGKPTTKRTYESQVFERDEWIATATVTHLFKIRFSTQKESKQEKSSICKHPRICGKNIHHPILQDGLHQPWALRGIFQADFRHILISHDIPCWI